jgi:hypothetical protein
MSSLTTASTLTVRADFLRGAIFVFDATTIWSRRLLRRLTKFDLKLDLLWRVRRADRSAGFVVDLDLDEDRRVALAEALGEIAGRAWREGRFHP